MKTEVEVVRGALFGRLLKRMFMFDAHCCVACFSDLQCRLEKRWKRSFQEYMKIWPRLGDRCDVQVACVRFGSEGNLVAKENLSSMGPGDEESRNAK